MSEEIGKLKVSLSLDGGAEFNKTISSAERNLKTMGGELAILRQKGKEWGDSVDGLKTRQETLGRTLKQQESYVKQLREAYDKSVKEKGKDAKATENLATKLNKAVAEYTRTETEIGQVNEALKRQQALAGQTETAWEKLSKQASAASEKMDQVAEKAKNAGEKLTVGVTAPLVGLGIASFKTANDFDASQGKIQASLGLTEEEAASLQDQAESLWKNGFGESINEAAGALVNIKKNMRDIPVDQLDKAAESAFTIADTFDKDLSEVTRSANQLMKDFGLTGDQSFDLITKGFQKGLDFSGEFLDVINEYSPQFKAVGFTADEFFDKLLVGAESGAFNLDKVGDAVKEFNIRAKDGSELTAESFKALNLNAEEMSQTFAKGGEEGAAAFNQVLNELAKIEDPVKRNEVAVGLFGTQFEDLEENVIQALSTTTGEFEKVEGATKKAGDALYDNWGTRATMAFRDFQADMEPAGEILAELAEEWLPKAAEKINEITQAFADMSPEAQENVIMLAGLAAAAGPAAFGFGQIAGGVGGLINVGKGLGDLLGKEGGKGLVGKLGLLGLGGPVGLAVAGTAGLAFGIGALIEKSKEYNGVNFEKIEAIEADIEATDSLIAQYEELEKKNKLSTDEMLRYMDVLTQLKDADSEEAIATLKDEQNELLKASGFTNEEMETFLGLNQQVIDMAPNTVQAISDEGNAYAENLDKLKELNAEKERELIRTAESELTKALDVEKEKLEEIKTLKSQIQEADAAYGENQRAFTQNLQDQRDVEAELRDINRELLSLEGQTTQEAEVKRQTLKSQRDEQEKLLTGLEAEETAITSAKDRLLEKIQSKNDDLATTQKEIAATEKLKGDYEQMILQQVGLTSEKGKGLSVLEQQIDKLRLQKSEARQLLETGQISTSEYNEQIGLIDTQIGKFQAAQGELKLVNDIAGRQVYKDMQINISPDVDEVNRRLSLPIDKLVNVDFSVRRSLDLAPIGNLYAHGTDNHPGGPAIVGDGTGFNAGRELIQLPGNKMMLSPSTPTMMNLPKGTSVLSAMKTKNLLGNVPKYANGTPDTMRLIDYQPQLNLRAPGSAIGRIRTERQGEIDSLEKMIALLTAEGATIEQLNQANELQAKLKSLLSKKEEEYQNRLKEQQIIVTKLGQAYRAGKITLEEYNERLADTNVETQNLKAEQLALAVSMQPAMTELQSTVERIRKIRQSDMDLLAQEIDYLTRANATEVERAQAKEKQLELDALRVRKQEEFQNKMRDQQKVIDEINTAYKAGQITQIQYNDLIGEATVKMNDLKSETLSFFESIENEQTEVAENMKRQLEDLMREAADVFTSFADSQRLAYETALDQQLKDLDVKNRKASEAFKYETDAFLTELDRQKDAALASFDAQTKAQEEAIERQIENIKKRRDAELTAIDEQLAALEELEKRESREEIEAGFSKEQENLKRRLTVANFMGDEDTVKAVQQEIADLDSTIAKQRLEWEREDLRESLQLEKEKINESYDQQEQALEDSLSLLKEQRDLERDALEERYELRAEQYEAMRVQQLEALELEQEQAMQAAEKEYELQRERFAALQEQLALHVEQGNLTQAQANEAWMQAVKDLGNEQVLQEIENQEKSKAALQEYVDDYLNIGKSYGNNLVDGVVGTLNSRLGEVESLATKIKAAMSGISSAGIGTISASAISAVMPSTMSLPSSTQLVNSISDAVSRTVPMTQGAPQSFKIYMDSEEIAAYTFSAGAGSLRQVSRKG